MCPPESPTLGLSHLQFEAMLATGRDSANPNDFAVAMFGLLGLRIFEATGSDVSDLHEVHGHRVLRVHGTGDKVVLVPLPPAVGRASSWVVGDRVTAERETDAVTRMELMAGHDERRLLRSAVVRGDGAAVAARLRSRPWPGQALQLIGDANYSENSSSTRPSATSHSAQPAHPTESTGRPNPRDLVPPSLMS